MDANASQNVWRCRVICFCCPYLGNYCIDPIYPIALIMAKQLYGVLMILSAIGLNAPWALHFTKGVGLYLGPIE